MRIITFLSLVPLLISPTYMTSVPILSLFTSLPLHTVSSNRIITLTSALVKTISVSSTLTTVPLCFNTSPCCIMASLFITHTTPFPKLSVYNKMIQTFLPFIIPPASFKLLLKFECPAMLYKLY